MPLTIFTWPVGQAVTIRHRINFYGKGYWLSTDRVFVHDRLQGIHQSTKVFAYTRKGPAGAKSFSEPSSYSSDVSLASR